MEVKLKGEITAKNRCGVIAGAEGFIWTEIGAVTRRGERYS